MSMQPSLVFPHFEQFRTVLLTKFAVEHRDGSLQVFPLCRYLPLSLLQQLHLFLLLPPQAFQVFTLLLFQETVEVLKLRFDLSFQGIKMALGEMYLRSYSDHPVWLKGIKLQYLHVHWLYVRLPLGFSAQFYLMFDSSNSLDELFLQHKNAHRLTEDKLKGNKQEEQESYSF